MQKIAPKDHVNKYFNYYVCTYEENNPQGPREWIIIIITILGLHISVQQIIPTYPVNKDFNHRHYV